MITPSYYLDAARFCAKCGGRRNNAVIGFLPIRITEPPGIVRSPEDTGDEQKDDGRKLLEDRHFRTRALPPPRFVPLIIPRIGSWKERARLHNGDDALITATSGKDLPSKRFASEKFVSFRLGNSVRRSATEVLEFIAGQERCSRVAGV